MAIVMISGALPSVSKQKESGMPALPGGFHRLSEIFGPTRHGQRSLTCLAIFGPAEV